MQDFFGYPNVRLRRNRTDGWIRNLCSEYSVTVKDLVLPIFIQEGANLATDIDSMPEVQRLSVDLAVDKALEAAKLGIPAIALFPNIDASLKSDQAEEAYNPNNLVCRAVKKIKKNVPDIGVICDVALDPYSASGHDGIVDSEGYVQNDKTVECLIKQALCLVEAGCDIVAPSDMMDGRVLRIRQALEMQELHNVKILAYSVKYASSFYGPFRDAVGSGRNLKKSDKKSYQMDPSRFKEALLEARLDVSEGADILMVKPGLPYLDVIKAISDEHAIPVFAYHVSGEYSMLKAAAEKGWINEQEVLMETMIAFKRAGAAGVFTYSAIQLAELL